MRALLDSAVAEGFPTGDALPASESKETDNCLPYILVIEMVKGADVIPVLQATGALVTSIVLRAGTVFSSVIVTVVAAVFPVSEVLRKEAALDAGTETVLKRVTITGESPDSEALKVEVDATEEVGVVLAVLWATPLAKGIALGAWIFVFPQFLTVTVLLSMTVLVRGDGQSYGVAATRAANNQIAI